MARLNGLVLEVGDNWAIILNSRGEYKKIKTKTLLHVGEMCQEPPGYTTKFALAAAILLMFLATAFSVLPVVAYAQVSSGIELGLNRWEWVVSTRPLNDEGRDMLQTVNLRGKSLDKAIELIVDNTLNSTDSGKKEIFLNVVAANKGKENATQRIMEKMDTTIQRILDRDKVKYNRDIEKGNFLIEPPSTKNNIESIQSPPQKGNQLKDGERDPANKFKGLEDQLKKRDKNTLTEGDEPIKNNQNKYQKADPKDFINEAIKNDANRGNDKSKEKNIQNKKI